MRSRSTAQLRIEVASHVAWHLALGPRKFARMTSRARKIIDDALALPKDELVGIVAELQQRVEATDSQQDTDAAWRDEVARRVRSIKDGSAVLFDGDQVDRELSEILEEG